ncbi:MAG: hypothetical protein KGJ09_02590 [Candidatus Omnitrophica bacterium]|nr:hypothetical protein [Candidatus Omnitrophota bacterium]MDE2008947.1 hypothetical protein [Candidatus Omnitrophota bacterium]MDE2213490.1 hypothetical protein [Candidatus Omnitrophota bacterium]MDE2230609.1 hypothetical protein [Candidatus Omnitrophota bacterium]
MKKISLVILTVLSLAGCATSLRYFSYTNHSYPPKPENYFIPVYSPSHKLPVSPPYQVIGKVDIQGDAANDVTPGLLSQEAVRVARKKGADAVIDAVTRAVPYMGTYVVPGYYGWYYYHPTTYVPYESTLLEFTGNLVVFEHSGQKI